MKRQLDTLTWRKGDSYIVLQKKEGFYLMKSIGGEIINVRK